VNEDQTEYEYVGYTIRRNARGNWFMLRDGANVAPGATEFASSDDAMQAVDVFEAVERDAARFWHLWRAIRGHG